MYILHSIDRYHSQLYREVGAMCPDLSDVKSMWCLVNLEHCDTNNSLDMDKALESGMYVLTPIHHYYWTEDNALPLDEDDREYSFIVLVNSNDLLMIARYGCFEPEHEPEQVWHWNSKRLWWSWSQIRAEDGVLADLLAPLYN